MSFSFRNLFGSKNADPSGGAAVESPPVQGAATIAADPQATSEGSFEAMFSSQSFVRNGSPMQGQGGPWATPPAPALAPQTYAVRELLPFVPKALAGGHDLPPEQKVTIPLPANGSTDTRLSLLYQACPQLFAVEITPLNDAPITLPAPGSWLGAALADRSSSLGLGSGPAFSSVSGPWQPPGPAVAAPGLKGPAEVDENPFGAADDDLDVFELPPGGDLFQVERSPVPMPSANPAGPWSSSLPPASGPWAPPQAQASPAPVAVPAQTPAPVTPEPPPQDWSSLFAQPVQPLSPVALPPPARPSRQEMVAQLPPSPEVAPEGKVPLNVRRLLAGVPQHHLGVSTLEIPVGAVAHFSADLIRVQASLANPGITLAELVGACAEPVRSMLMTGNPQARIPLPANELFHALSEETDSDYLPPAAQPQSSLPPWMVPQEASASPPWADPDALPPVAPPVGASAAAAFDTPFSAFAREEAEQPPFSMPLEREDPFSKPAPSAQPLFAVPPSAPQAEPWKAEIPAQAPAKPVAAAAPAAAPSGLDAVFSQPWTMPGALGPSLLDAAPEPEVLPDPVWQGFLDPEPVPAKAPLPVSSGGASLAGPAFPPQSQPFTDGIDPFSGGASATLQESPPWTGLFGATPPPVDEVLTPPAPSVPPLAFDPYAGSFAPAAAGPLPPAGTPAPSGSLDDLDDLPSFALKAPLPELEPAPKIEPSVFAPPPMETAKVEEVKAAPVPPAAAPETPFQFSPPAEAVPPPSFTPPVERAPQPRKAVFSVSQPHVGASSSPARAQSAQPAAIAGPVDLPVEKAPAPPAVAASTPTAAPAPAPIPVPVAAAPRREELPLRDIELRAVFGTQERFDAARIANLSADLPGVLACVVSTPSQSAAAARAGAEADLERLQADREALFQGMKTFARLTGMTDAETFTVHTDRGALSFFVNGARFLTVRHASGGFDPGVREKLILVARGLGGIDQSGDE